MKYHCKIRKCNFTINSVSDNFMVNNSNFHFTSSFIHAVNTSQVLNIGMGYRRYTPFHTILSALNYSWDMFHALQLIRYIVYLDI